MSDVPSGTVTLLFTDIEGSTRLLREHGPLYGQILDDHARILREAFAAHGGREIDTQGDSFFVAFRTAQAAVDAAVDAQRTLAAHAWPGGGEPKVRMGMHTGEPLVSGERYVGLAVHRAARICAAGHGCQVLLSSATGNLVADTLPPALNVADLGEHRLKDFDRPERVFQLVADDLPSSFPPLRTLEAELPAAAEEDGARPLPGILMGRLPWLVLAFGLLVLVPLAAIVARRDDAGAVSVPSRSIAVIDPRTNDVRRAIPLGASPSSLASFDGAVWAASPRDRTLARVDPRTGEVIERLGVTVAPQALAGGDGVLWVGGGASGDIVRFVPQAGAVEERPAVQGPLDGYPVLSPSGRDLWFGGNDGGGVALFDANRSRVLASVGRRATPEALAASSDLVWVVERFDQEVTGFDRLTGDVRARVPLGAPIPRSSSGSTIHEPLSAALLFDGGLWVTDALEGKVWRIRAAQGSVEDTIRVGPGALAIASGEGSIWVANRADGTVSRIDPRTDRVTATIDVASRVSGIAVAGGEVWVGVP